MRRYVNVIILEYQKTRDNAKREQETRTKEIYAKIPEIKLIDKQIAMTSIEFSKMVLNKEININEKIKELESSIKKLKQEKAFMMTENNFPHEYLEIQHICNYCKDTGFLPSGEKCKCFKQKLVNFAYEMSNLHEVFKRENFSTFDINIFSDEKYEDFDDSPKQNMKKILAYSDSFVHDFDSKNENLLFYGATGLGKTFLCNCIAKALLDKGYTVIYQTSFKIIEILEINKFSKSKDPKDKENYQMLFDCDLLVIDDLGTEMVNSFTNMELFNIINERLLKRKNTIISTNIQIIDLTNTYSERLTSRIFGNFKHLEFYGQDVRWER